MFHFLCVRERRRCLCEVSRAVTREAVMIRIWIFYLNYYESRPFVVGQTSIRKLTSNLDKFRFDRHVLIRYSVFNRNLQPADLLCQQRCDIASALHGGHTIGDKQREFLKFVGVFSQCIYFDSLSTHKDSVHKPCICVASYFWVLLSLYDTAVVYCRRLPHV